MLNVGDHVPDFELPVAYSDGRKEKLQLKTVLGNGPVVLSFFPLAFTRVCTTQMCDARDHHTTMDQLHARTLGFSCDSVFVNAKFAAAEALPTSIGILSDANREVVEKIWATEDVAGVNRVPKRGWLLLNKDGVVAAKYVAEKPGDAWPGNAPIEQAIARLR